jgi:predicted membrane-bound spermidine synthase
MAACAAVSMIVVVYLGRNWILCTLAAIPFAFAAATVAERAAVNLVLRPHRKPERVLRQGEVAVPIDPSLRVVEWYSAMFFLSAFAGVLSQVAWQRTLFDILGSGTPTAAVVSTSVMVGLGLGFFVGIRVSRHSAISLASALSAAQVAVGLFCFASMPLLHLIGRLTTDIGFAFPEILAFVALLPPTILAGAMVPLLVMDHVRRQHSVGDAVGRLVFMGALGAAAAAGFAALVLLGPLGLTATVQLAGVLNVGIGVLVFAREHRLMTKR